MPEVRDLIVVGAGPFALEVVWVAHEMNESGRHAFSWNVLGFADDNPNRRGEAYEGLPILGTAEEVARDLGEGTWFHVAIGTNRQRQKVALFLESRGLRPATLIHSSVVFGPGTSVGDGTYIGALTVVAPQAVIGRHALINTHVGVGHHSVTGDFAQLCPGARLNGYCILDRLAFVGSNAVIHPYKRVGEGATVGSSSYVIRSVEPHVTVMGVPARIISKPAADGSTAQ
jgi:sugar O-acyltransferase (sialic acid O-acetyltransferase NeuD family)